MIHDAETRLIFLDEPVEIERWHSRRRVAQKTLPASSVLLLALAGDMLSVLVFSILLERFFNPSHLSWLQAAAALTLPMLVFAFFGHRARLYKTETVMDFRRYRRQLVRRAPWLILLLTIVEFLLLPILQPVANISVASATAAIAVGFGLLWVVMSVVRFSVTGLCRAFIQAGLICHRVVVIGATEAGLNFINALHNAQLGARVMAVFDDGYPPTIGSFGGVPVQGGISKLLHFHKHYDIDTVVVATPMTEGAKISAMVNLLKMQPLRVRALPAVGDAPVPEDWCAPWDEVPGAHLLPLWDLPIKSTSLVLKLLFDKAAALGALLLFGPLMLICASVIKLTSAGPVFFMQPRIGLRNRNFMVYKFRSMHVSDCGHTLLTTRSDKRVFPFGNIMRKFSLDELPQLFNVLKGDMSMVGPRPHMPQARAAGVLYYDIVPDYAARHRVRPGITGLAQVNGWRGPTETFEQIEQRVVNDLEYIERWSLMLDFKILLRTAIVGFFGKNAF